MEKLDVVMPTLNSVSRIGVDVFRKVLQRIFTEIPVNRLIAVDDRSKDETLDVLKEFGVTILNGIGSLGKIRKKGMENRGYWDTLQLWLELRIKFLARLKNVETSSRFESR